MWRLESFNHRVESWWMSIFFPSAKPFKATKDQNFDVVLQSWIVLAPQSPFHTEILL